MPPEALLFQWLKPVPPVVAQAQVALVRLPGANRRWHLRGSGADMAQRPATGPLGEGVGVAGLIARVFVLLLLHCTRVLRCLSCCACAKNGAWSVTRHLHLPAVLARPLCFWDRPAAMERQRGRVERKIEKAAHACVILHALKF